MAKHRLRRHHALLVVNGLAQRDEDATPATLVVVHLITVAEYRAEFHDDSTSRKQRLSTL